MSTHFKRILYGGDYNPNQWPKDIWQEDMRIFKDAHINTATINVFSWAKIQPSEHEYNFDDYGVTNPMVARAVKRTRSRCVGWSIRSLDTLRHRSREAVARRIRRRLGDGKVILLHDDRPGAGRLLALVLDDLERRGYRTATVCELFKTEKP